MSLHIHQRNFLKEELVKSLHNIEEMQSSLLNWFDLNGRHWIPWKLNAKGMLPKKGEKLPVYPIWIAEVMLQQTQLKVALPFWEKWMKAFPKLSDLASSSEQKILIHWQGLGYYSRAHRIHKGSKLLVKILGQNDSLDVNEWSSDLKFWMDLPGIGRTTAASIISSAFDFPEPILDGNVKRILFRVFGIKDISTINIQKIWELSERLIDRNSPRNFNQALMDLGSTVCTKSQPRCFCCPWNIYCFAYHDGDPARFPTKISKKVKLNLIIGIGLVINDSGEILIDQRMNNQSMAGMWEFPGGKQEEGESIENTIRRELFEELAIQVEVREKLLEFDHFYTHKKFHFVVHICKIISGDPMPLESLQIKWVTFDKLENYPFPSANQKMIVALRDYLALRKSN